MIRCTVFAVIGLMCLSGADCATTPTGGGTLSGTVDQVTGARLMTPMLGPRGSIFVDGIGTYRLGDSVSGEQSLAMFLDGPPSCFSDGKSARLAINSAGQLLVFARFAGDCDDRGAFFVNVYADATRLNGVQQPIRTAILEDPFRSAGSSLEMAIDRDRDVIYVTSEQQTGGSDLIFAYEGTTRAAFDGVVSPVRTIVLPATLSALRLAVSGDDVGYLVGGGVTRIPNLSAQDGELIGDDLDNVIGLGAIENITVDSRNRLWLLRRNPQTGFDPFTGNIMRMNPDFDGTELSVLISFAAFPYNIRLDAQGSVYLDAGNDLRIYDDIESGSATEELAPSRIATNVQIRDQTPYILVE